MIFGPINVPSLSKSGYYVSFIDDYSRRAFVYFPKIKSKMFSQFKELKNLVVNPIGKKIKFLRIEYCSKKKIADFERYCKDHSIKRHKTTPYTPKKNEVVEMLNRMVMERVRSMLISVGLEKKFWAEVVATTCYLVNQSPSSTLVDKIPMESWSSKKPSLRYIQVFGYEEYSYVLDIKKYKLEKKEVKCIFIGYGNGVKGYKL